MRTLSLAMAACIAVASMHNASAQTTTTTQSGLYESAADFNQGKLSYTIDCSGGNRVETHALFGSSSVTIVQNGQKKTFPKKQLYGYRDCHNQVYRFIGNEAYRITDTAGFFVYTTYKEKQGPNGKGWIKTDEYYFSTTGDATLQLLTIDNLKKAFPNNHRFQYEIDGLCRTDRELVDYDVYTKTYRVKYLFSQSFK